MVKILRDTKILARGRYCPEKTLVLTYHAVQLFKPIYEGTN